MYINLTSIILFLWANSGLFLFIFVPFSLQFQYKLKKSIVGMLGIRTWGHRMVGADNTMELWRPLILMLATLMLATLMLATLMLAIYLILMVVVRYDHTPINYFTFFIQVNT